MLMGSVAKSRSAATVRSNSGQERTISSTRSTSGWRPRTGAGGCSSGWSRMALGGPKLGRRRVRPGPSRELRNWERRSPRPEPEGFSGSGAGVVPGIIADELTMPPPTRFGEGGTVSLEEGMVSAAEPDTSSGDRSRSRWSRWARSARRVRIARVAGLCGGFDPSAPSSGESGTPLAPVAASR